MERTGPAVHWECERCPYVEITDQDVIIADDDNTVRLSHSEWNELVRLIITGQLGAITT